MPPPLGGREGVKKKLSEGQPTSFLLDVTGRTDTTVQGWSVLINDGRVRGMLYNALIRDNKQLKIRLAMERMAPIKSWSEIDNKEFDFVKTHEKSDLAKDQLRTAIWLFLNRIDLASAITLAGASGNILHALVEQQGKQPMLEFARLLCDELIGFVPKRKKYLKHFGDLTGINSLKHMSLECPDTIEIDLEKSAEIAITRAVLDFIKLYGDAEARKNEAVNAFMQWLWRTRYGEKMMEEYEALPAELKRKWD